jgi:hypothetical protein
MTIPADGPLARILDLLGLRLVGLRAVGLRVEL